ncbi:hypothetical protein BOX15_Mlig003349g1 [Macrostomum lignano]|uniref:Mitochondrial carrier protein n=1 Tax=Macrostomum lignano TaxID=282301 RepID=A0A267DQD9_9PLAT|nr:hypothetical protein BOX15_Mlig003349g1 [Macrostomum lignano]
MEGSLAHIIAGGVAGTTGALFTSPLEIVKTRLQGSVNTWSGPTAVLSTAGAGPQSQLLIQQGGLAARLRYVPSNHLSIMSCVRHIYRAEGARALFKGLTMTIAGVLPSRAIYFGAYFNGQEMFAPAYAKGTHGNVFAASSFASFVSSTLTNPIWYVKTRMQLDQSPSAKSLTVWQCTVDTWRRGGFFAFFKGIQASYIGIVETSLQFVLYEHLKRNLMQMSRGADSSANRDLTLTSADDVLYCTLASGISKTVSTVTCYPHEVLRTRLRQEGSRYHGLAQSLRLIVHEEGFWALYKGMLTHFVRQIPNTCIVLTTYEASLHLFRAKNVLL